MDDAALRTYLADHLAGARFATELVRRRLDRGDGPPYLEELLEQLHEEREAVGELAEAVGSAGLAKQALGFAAHVGAQAKLLADVALSPALRDLLELEVLVIGVEGKRRLLRSLQAVADDPRVAALDPDRLIARADAQAEELERHRRAAAAVALGGA